MAIKHVVTSEWDSEVIKSNIPVLVDFWATWCVPCKMIGKILEQVEDKYEGKVQFVKLNADEEQEIATQYQIRALPTIIIFRNGEIVEKVVGAISKGKLLKLVDKYAG
jgi:thioredoxin 1